MDPDGSKGQAVPGLSAAAIAPFLWFHRNAEEAAAFYKRVFGPRPDTSSPRNSELKSSGGARVVEFGWNGQRFLALSGGQRCRFNEAVSFLVRCNMQEEIDYFWAVPTEGGLPDRCGWPKHRFGLSWQVVPRSRAQSLGRGRSTEAIMGMSRLDIARLQSAAGVRA